MSLDDRYKIMPDTTRLQQQIQFLTEIDKLKQVLRRTWLLDQSRYEKDAEHSWHIAVAAMLFLEYADDPKLDVLRVIKMLLVHDLVEIDAGDTYAYDEKACLDQPEREQKAAERVFGLLPPDQATEFRGLVGGVRGSADARGPLCGGAGPLPAVVAQLPDGRSGVAGPCGDFGSGARAQLSVVDGAPLLGQYAEDLIRDAVAKGYLAE